MAAKAALLALGLAAGADPAFFLREGDGCVVRIPDATLAGGDPVGMVAEARALCRKGATIRLVPSRGSRRASDEFLAHICEGPVTRDSGDMEPWDGHCTYRGPPPVP